MLEGKGSDTTAGTDVPLVFRLEQAGPVHASGDTTRALGIHGEQFIDLQISQPCNATEIGLDAAIRSTGGDGGAKIGVATLHGDEAALLGPA